MEYQKWYKEIVDITYDAISHLRRINTRGENIGVVFDIDDTLLHTDGNPILPMINLYNYVKSLDMVPIIITYRSGDPKSIEYTRKQLDYHGITGYRFLYCRPPDRITDPYRYKFISRKNATERGYKIVMSFGDQNWDIGQYGGMGYILPVYKK